MHNDEKRVWEVKTLKKKIKKKKNCGLIYKFNQKSVDIFKIWYLHYLIYLLENAQKVLPTV